MKKAMLWIFVVILTATSVAAQTIGNAFDTLENLGIIGSFTQHPFIWDFILVIWIFNLLGKTILSKPLGSEKYGGSLGAALGLGIFGGMIYLDFSLIRDFFMWVVPVALVGLFVMFFKMFRSGNNKGIGALGVFLITSFLVSHEGIATQIRQMNDLLMGILVIIWLLSAVFTVTWAFSLFPSTGAPDGTGGGGFLNRLGNFIGNTRDGINHIRNNLNPHQPPANNAQLEARIDVLVQSVNQFSNDANGLIQYIVHFAPTRSQAIAAGGVPPDFNHQINTRLLALQPQIQFIAPEIQAIDQADLNSASQQHQQNFSNSSATFLHNLTQIAGVLA